MASSSIFTRRQDLEFGAGCRGTPRGLSFCRPKYRPCNTMAEEIHAGFKPQFGSPSQGGRKSSRMSPTKSMTFWAVGIAVMVLFSCGCATPVGVERLDEQAAHR